MVTEIHFSVLLCWAFKNISVQFMIVVQMYLLNEQFSLHKIKNYWVWYLFRRISKNTSHCLKFRNRKSFYIFIQWRKSAQILQLNSMTQRTVPFRIQICQSIDAVWRMFLCGFSYYGKKFKITIFTSFLWNAIDLSVEI